MQQRHADTVINAVKVAVIDTDTALYSYVLPIKLQLLLAVCFRLRFAWQTNSICLGKVTNKNKKQFIIAAADLHTK